MSECGMDCPIFQALAVLRRDSRIGPAVRSCFEWLWHATGGRPDYVVVEIKRVAFGYGVSCRAVWKWVAALEENGLVEVIERDRRRGVIHVYIFHPRPEKRTPRPDPQLRLDFGTDLCAPKGPRGEGGADLCAHKGPRGDSMPRAGASDRDEEEEISSSSSLSMSGVDGVKRAMGIRKRLFGDGKPNLRHLDKVFFVSAVVLAAEQGERGKMWLKESIELTVEHRPGKPVSYLKAVMREGVSTYLGLCDLDGAADKFGKMLLGVRPKVERMILEYREAAAAVRTARNGSKE